MVENTINTSAGKENIEDKVDDGSDILKEENSTGTIPLSCKVSKLKGKSTGNNTKSIWEICLRVSRIF